MPTMSRLAPVPFVLLLGLGCGSSKPPAELVSARASYDVAKRSQAKDLVPDRLLEAQQALELAEREFGEDGNSEKARSLAYVADRKSTLAVVLGDTAAAGKTGDRAEVNYTRHLETKQHATSSELDRTKSMLSAQGNDLEKEKAARADAEAGRAKAEKETSAAMASLAEIAKIKEDQRGMVITLSGGVLFRTNDSTLLPIAAQQLGKVAQALLEQDASKLIQVVGHTDSRGSAARNMQLSQARADAVRAFLVSGGVPAERVSAMGRGKNEPIAENNTAEGRANNRRVEIIVAP